MSARAAGKWWGQRYGEDVIAIRCDESDGAMTKDRTLEQIAKLYAFARYRGTRDELAAVIDVAKALGFDLHAIPEVVKR